METSLCKHNDVEFHPIENTNFEDKFQRKYFRRQMLVSSSIWAGYFMAGLSQGATTVMIPQLRMEQTVSEKNVSWISSIQMYAAIAWVIILPILTNYIGRKYVHFVVNLATLVCFIVLYCSQSILVILIGLSMQGSVMANNVTVSVIAITEYTSPKYRGIFLTTKSAMFGWGLWVANALGTFYYWKTITVLGLVLAICNLLAILFWPESVYWLANKRKFDQCSKEHRWLKGTGKTSEKELEDLITSQTVYYEAFIKSSEEKYLKQLFHGIQWNTFYKPFLLSCIVMGLYSFAGKLVCSTYSIDVIKKISGNEATAYTGMLILDGITVAGMYLGSISTKFFRRRILFITYSSIGIVSLYLLSLYLYLCQQKVVTESVYLSIGLLMLYSMFCSSGPFIMSSSLYGEMIPLRRRSLFVICVGVLHYITLATTLKYAPVMFRSFSLSGSFLFYAVISTFLLSLFGKYFPETKDKSLVEIESAMLNQKGDKKQLTTELNLD